MRHRATRRFWSCYRQLSRDVQRLADRCYELWRQDPHHPSLHFKKVGRFWSVRVGLHYRALAVEQDSDLIWLDYLEAGDTLDEFLKDFPSVSRELAVAALELAKSTTGLGECTPGHI